MSFDYHEGTRSDSNLPYTMEECLARREKITIRYEDLYHNEMDPPSSKPVYCLTGTLDVECTSDGENSSCRMPNMETFHFSPNFAFNNNNGT